VRDRFETLARLLGSRLLRYEEDCDRWRCVYWGVIKFDFKNNYYYLAILCKSGKGEKCQAEVWRNKKLIVDCKITCYSRDRELALTVANALTRASIPSELGRPVWDA